MTQNKRIEFVKGVKSIVNILCLDNESNTPDFILAEHLACCLENFIAINTNRHKWSTNPTMTEINTKDDKCEYHMQQYGCENCNGSPGLFCHSSVAPPDTDRPDMFIPIKLKDQATVCCVCGQSTIDHPLSEKLEPIITLKDLHDIIDEVKAEINVEENPLPECAEIGNCKVCDGACAAKPYVREEYKLVDTITGDVLVPTVPEGHEICSGCNQRIDPNWCHCGSSKDAHKGWSGENHGFVPMGCRCHEQGCKYE